MEVSNKAFSSAGVMAEEYPLLLSDAFFEEVGEIKLEIHRVRNRVNVIKSFYQHMRNTSNQVVRRELEDKVNADVDIITATLARIQSSLNRWESENNERKKTELAKVTNYLREVLNNYFEILDEHRNANLTELKQLLKSTSYDEENGGAANEKNHIEIEERYAELLRIDIALRNLKIKFSNLIPSNDYTELAVLQMSQYMDPVNDFQDSKPVSSFYKTIFFAGLLGTSIIFVIIMLYIML